MKLASTIALALSLTHCGTAAPLPQASDPKTEAELDAQIERREALRADFARAPGRDRQRCELEAGDCRMEVAEGRDEILRDHSSPQCRAASDSDAELSCVAQALSSSGKGSIASGYYRLENWCLSALLTCTARVADEAVQAAQQTARNNRRERIVGSRAGMAAQAQVTFADERNAYLRALLPAGGEAVCEDQSAKACQQQAQAVSAEFEAELAKDDASYDEKKADALYEASFGRQAECRAPEAECLTRKLDGYGGNAETRRHMAQTLKSLARRQELVIQAGAEASEACINAGVEQYQSRIVDSYRRFAREPVLFFQVQLHKDFRVLYDAQVGCLQSTVRPPRKPGGTRSAARPDAVAPEG